MRRIVFTLSEQDEAKLAHAPLSAVIAAKLTRNDFEDWPAEPISPGQMRAFHAKANALEKQTGRIGLTKPDALAATADHYQREIDHASDLTTEEASYAIDWLQHELDAARAVAA